MTEIIVIVPDLQVPYHWMPGVQSLANFIKQTKPSKVVSAGDEIDFQTISRWSKGTPLEYQGSIGKDRDTTVKILEMLKVQHVIRSNHTDRLYSTVMTRSPGLLGAPELELEKFLRFDQLGITYHRKPYALAPDWLLMHGDEGSCYQEAGKTASGLARRTGKSVVCGHTHRAGLVPFTQSYGHKENKTLWGLEVGNLMDFTKATYLKGGMGNWQHAFGMLMVEGKEVTPQLVPMRRDGSFHALGRKWTA